MKQLTGVLILVMLAVLLTACGSQPKISLSDPPDKLIRNNGDSNDFHAAEQPDQYIQNAELENSTVQWINAALYFLDEKSNRLSPETRQVLQWNEQDVIVNIINELIQGPEDTGLRAVIAPETTINKVEQAENILTVNLSRDFLQSEDPIVARAALVNTLTEMEQIRYVKIYVDDRELTANGRESGHVMGLLTRYPNNLAEILAAETRDDETTEVRRVNRELFFQDIQGLYLLPEVRTLSVPGDQHAETIIEELIKGPVHVNDGMYPTLPKGTKLNKTEMLRERGEERTGIALYFSKEFKTQFAGGSSQEMATLGSLVYSLTALSDISYIKVYYEGEEGVYKDQPLHSISLDQPLTLEQFDDMIGRRIRIYFGDRQGAFLVHEYRAMRRSNTGIARRILQELMTQPNNPDAVRVIPEDIGEDAFKVLRIDGETAVISLPARFFEDENSNTGRIRDLYAIVNSLTDPVNTSIIRQVQFVVDGRLVEDFQEISLSDPFVRNPALIRE